MFKHILLAVDPSASHRSSLKLATDMAKLTNANVTVVHVVPISATLGAVVPLEEDADARALVDGIITTLRGSGVSADGRVMRALTTQVASTISAVAQDVSADLLILSPHHRSLLESFISPRVSDAVVHGSHLAVLLAPDGSGTESTNQDQR
ncbi:universal stress protein [Streptomyces sp. NPDC002740]